jgi:hypothetical protein
MLADIAIREAELATTRENTFGVEKTSGQRLVHFQTDRARSRLARSPCFICDEKVAPGPVVLPVELSAKLQAPCGVGSRDCPEIRVAQIRIGRKEVRMVESVE